MDNEAFIADEEENGDFLDKSQSDSSQFQFPSRSLTASTVDVEDIQPHCSVKDHVSVSSLIPTVLLNQVHLDKHHLTYKKC